MPTRETLQRWRYNFIPDHLLGEILSKRWTDNAIPFLAMVATVVGFGSIWLTYFMSGPIESYTDLLRNDGAKFIKYRRGMLDRGIFELPLNLKRNHISAAHTDAHIDDTLNAAEDVLRTLV